MHRNLMGALCVAALVAVAGCGGDKKPAAAVPATGGSDKPAAAAPAGGGKYDAGKSNASVKFTVKWTGAKPAPLAKTPTGDAVCVEAHKDKPMMDERFTMGDDGSLPNTFVWAHDGPHKGLTGFPEPAPFVLDQKGCMYVPHVFGVRVGQNFTIKNSDGTTHNVHAKPKANKPYNVAQSAGAQNEHSFSIKERAIQFNCDIHSWMSATSFVLDHPFFGTTAADGSLTISGLPAGTYKFKVWHEGFTADKMATGLETEVEVVVKEGETVSKPVEMK